jgi:hypothetical protein
MAYGDFETAVGTEVGVVRRGRSGVLMLAKFGTVTKINGHGHIFVKSGDTEYRFTRRGDAYKNTWGPTLCHAAQLRAEMIRDEQRKDRICAAREIESVINGGWSYSGTFHVSRDRVDQLKTLVAKLETLIAE